MERKEKIKKITHASIIPLIGGFALATTKATGYPPEFIASYKAFEKNDDLYLRYLDKKDIKVPYYIIDDETPPDLSKHIKKIDFINAVPPCAGLSAAGALKKGERQNSPVNDWMKNAAQYVLETLQPKVYAFENAPGLYTNVGDVVREDLTKMAVKYGYGLTFYKTDTLLHGIPQRRPRTYAIFVKGNYAAKLNYSNVVSPNVAEYLKDIPEDATMQDMFMSKEPDIKNYEIVRFLKEEFGDKWRQEFLDTKEHLTSYEFLSRRNLLEKYKKFVDSDPNSHPSSIKDINHVIKKLAMGKNYRLAHRVLCIDKHHVYAVIGEMMERNIHPTEDRRINMREYMKLMGMPNDFDLYNKEEFGKLPQNTPVTTSEFISNEAIAIIKGEREFSNERVLMQNNIKYNQNKDLSSTIKLF